MIRSISSPLSCALCILFLAATPLGAENTRSAVSGDDNGEAARLDPAEGYDDLRNTGSGNYRDSDGYYVDGGGKSAKPVIPQGEWGYGRTPPSVYDRDGSGNTDYVRFETSNPRFNAIANFAFNNPGACISQADHDYAAVHLLEVCGPRGSYNSTLGMICSMDGVPVCR
jgi:hypothetical protein